VNEHATEPVRGLPARLPAGETVLWQGSPGAWSLARRACHIGHLALYFAVLQCWHLARLPAGADHGRRCALSALWMTGISAAALLLLVLLAWLISRTTIYTITSRRLIFRFGVALPMTVNIPFSLIEAGGLRVYRDGSGEIPLSLAAAARISFPVLWPHVRPWRLRRVEPMLRCIPQAEQAGQILAQALAAAQPGSAVADRSAPLAAGLRGPASVTA
jgi:Bacterial PH domain